MLAESTKVSSPSRTYVAVCNKGNFDGHYFRRFRLPESYQLRRSWESKQVVERPLVNNADIASWYFLNFLDPVACINGCVTHEDFQNCQDVSE